MGAPRVTTNRALAATALVLGALAAAAGAPRPSTPGQIDVDELASMVVHEQDHVDAIDLAEWIRDQKPGLRVVDVRTESEFVEYHVPAAENIPIEALSRAHFAPNDTIVMYSQGGAHAAQAWVLLRALGYKQVFFLSGGLDEWAIDVMSPVLPDDATAAEQQAFARISEISRYFGGIPHTGPRPAPGAASPAASVLTKLKRRGC
jgi:rhodanese-related sulfurtransferase